MDDDKLIHFMIVSADYVLDTVSNMNRMSII